MKKVTAREFIEQLNADPEWLAAEAAREAARQGPWALLRQAEQPVIEDLRAAGYDVETVWDLVNTTADYADAVPILIRHLGQPYPDKVREGIARALAIRHAKSVWEQLVRLYRAEAGPTQAKDGLAVAIAVAADDEVIADVIELIRDVGQGSSRIFFLRALKRSRDPAADQTISDLASDPDLSKEIAFMRRRQERRKSGPAR